MTDHFIETVFPARSMSVRDLAGWGMQDVAYIKRVVVDGTEGWAIHAADGATIGMAHERAVAFAAVRQHDLEPLSVH
jgi:hypothetical protein